MEAVLFLGYLLVCFLSFWLGVLACAVALHYVGLLDINEAIKELQEEYSDE